MLFPMSGVSTSLQKMKNMLELGQSVYIENAVSKKGNTFSVKVHFGKNERGRMGIIPEFN